MANREALRELQTRLASRLQAAREEGVAVSWLAIKAGGARYIFPLAQSGEIFPLASVQPVPYAQPWLVGVANLRGRPTVMPKYRATLPMGQGFSQIAAHLIALRAG